MGGATLQRLFSNFAGGWAGMGLLLQRVGTGGIAIHLLVTRLSAAHHVDASLPVLVVTCCGLLAVLGLGTPLAGIALSLSAVWAVFDGAEDWCVAAFLATMGTTL